MLRPYIIAEVAQAHDGNINIAHAFIDAVANTKAADAIKFQTHFADEESMPEEKWRKKFSRVAETRFEYWKRMEFSEDQWVEIKYHCQEVGLDFLSSPFSLKAAKLLSKIGMQTWKIASGEVTNFPMLDYIANLGGQKFIISTGLCSTKELEECIKRIRTNKNQVEILACISKYPAPIGEINLKYMDSLGKKFQCKTGLSDHSASIYPCLTAYTQGATTLEVHVSFHRDYFGPDNPASLMLEDLTELRHGLDQIQVIMSPAGDVDKKNTDAMRSLFLKSIVVNENMSKGQKIQLNHLAFKKPGTGISASEYEKVVGSELLCDKLAGELLRYGDFCG